MNGLEALEEVKCDMEYVTRLDFVEPIVRGEVRDNLFKIYHKELPHLDTIEKELKALEIIKTKKVYMTRLMSAESVEYYNKLYNDRFSLTKDEFDLLKEVLGK